MNNNVFTLQDFAKNKAIPQGEDQIVYFPPVWNWSQQFSTKDQTLFNNPMYVGKGAACVQNGEVKTFRRTKVRETLTKLCKFIVVAWIYNKHFQRWFLRVFSHVEVKVHGKMLSLPFVMQVTQNAILV